MDQAMTISDATADYLRRSRRARARHAPDSPALYRALKSIADEHDQTPQTPRTVEERFAEYVDRQLEAGILRWSRRAKLLKMAERAGIGRFEANLIIASVQYRHGMKLAPDARPSRRWLAPVLAFAAVQGAIVAGVWYLVAG
jgi:hypothetical protein